jgi:hypothetical protein
LALTPNDNEAFFREVTDDLRQDQMKDLFQRWGKLGATLLAAALAALALFLWWQNHRKAEAGADSETLSAVIADMDQGKVKPDDPRLANLAQDSRKGYRAMAMLTQAGIAADSDPKDAAKRYRAIAEDAALPQPTRDLALIRGTTLEFDTLPPAEVVARMKPLAVAGGPWFGSAAELTGAAYLKMNRRDLAGPLFAAIARDESAPSTLRARAAGMATSLGQTVAQNASGAALKE